MSPYDHRTVEAKWQDRWEKARVAEVDLRNARGKYYMLMMFPYPSGDRLHVGHGRNYILGDALYRYQRMRGSRALNPMGWDAFGLPAENAAIQRGVHPRDWTLENIRVMKKQFRRWGILYVPAHAREGDRLQEAGTGQLVSELPDRAGQRAGDRRRL
jgi:leucyl-tRNA synthetase